MNEKANEVLAQLMERALNGVDAAVEFSQHQVPAVVEQLLLWKSVESVIWFLIGLAFLVAGVWWVCFVFTRRPVDGKETNWFYRDGRRNGAEVFSAFSVFPIGIGCIMIAGNLTWLKIWLAPKLYLLEYGASLIK